MTFRAEVLSDLIPAYGVGALVLLALLLVGARAVQLPGEGKGEG
jgi:hypothetical protein